jgi:hypothetical protein
VSGDSITGVVDQHSNGFGSIAKPLRNSRNIPRFVKIGDKNLALNRELLCDGGREGCQAITASSDQD